MNKMDKTIMKSSANAFDMYSMFHQYPVEGEQPIGLLSEAIILNWDSKLNLFAFVVIQFYDEMVVNGLEVCPELFKLLGRNTYGVMV